MRVTETRRNWRGVRIRRLEPGERYSVFVQASPSGTLPDINDRVRARGRRGAEWIGTIAAVRMTTDDGAWVVLAEPPPWIDPATVARAETQALRELHDTRTRQQAGVCLACDEPAEPECPCVGRKREQAAAKREARLKEEAEAAEAAAAKAERDKAPAALATLGNLPVDEIRAVIESAGYDLQVAGKKLGLIDMRHRDGWGCQKGASTKQQLSNWLRRKRNATWGPDMIRQSQARKTKTNNDAGGIR